MPDQLLPDQREPDQREPEQRLAGEFDQPEPFSGKPALPKRLSHSSADTFRTCPRRWRFRYVDRLVEPPSEELAVGSFVHLVLEHLMAAAPANRTLDAARQIATQQWRAFETSSDFVGLELTSEQTAQFKWRAWSHVEGFFRQTNPVDIDVVAREERLETTVADVPFVGVIDLVTQTDDGIRITDYKTGRTPSPRWAEGKLSQVWLYAAAYEAQTLRSVGSVRLQYLPNPQAPSRYPGAVIERPLDAEAVDAAASQHSETYSQIGNAVVANEFAPTPNSLCGWCAFHAHCPEGTEHIKAREAQLGQPDG